MARVGRSRSSTPPASSRARRPSWPSFCSACSRRPSHGSPGCSPPCASGRRRPAFSPPGDRSPAPGAREILYESVNRLPPLDFDSTNQQQDQLINVVSSCFSLIQIDLKNNLKYLL